MSIGSMKGMPAGLRLHGLDLGQQLGAALLVALGKLRLELVDRFRPRPPQRDPARQRAAHGAADRDVGGEPEVA